MIINYHEKSVEVAMHSAIHPVFTDEDSGEEWTECQCEYVSTIQAQYDFSSSHKVRVVLDSLDSYHSRPIWLTPNKARELASYLTFAANDAETLDKEFPVFDE